MRRVLLGGPLILCAAPVFSADYVQMSGKDLYLRFCAACHGLVIGAVSRSLLARPIIGSTAERVIDHVGCDVFVVKPPGFKSQVKDAAVKV